MNKDTLKSTAAKLNKGIKKEKALSDLTMQLLKITVETAFSAELD